MTAPDEWVAAGIYDPAAPDAAQRLELLEWLDAQGVDLPSIIDACARGQLTSVAGDRKLRPGPRMTVHELASATNLPPDLVTAVHRSTGMAPSDETAAVYTQGDIQLFQLFADAAEFFSPAELGHFTRVVGNSMRRIAEAAGEMFLRDVEAPLYTERGGTPLEMAKANLAGIELAHMATGIFDPLFRAHLEVATRTVRRAREGQDDYSTVPLTIGFVDLNGFTSRSGTMSPTELLDLVMTFESVSIDLVAEHGGRLVKLIGDEVMFSSVEPLEACVIATGLVRHASSLLGGGRAGLAYGHVIASGGDVYGEIVNMAARIVDIAVPGEILVNEAVTTRADGLRFDPAGRRQLKGFAEPVRLWSLEP
jgi:class 3 adenylate cyclase